jgi:hypothetical protein
MTAEEGRHAPGPPPWEERWWFDFAGSGWGGYVRLAFRPWEGVAWYWAAVAGADRSLVALRAHDVPIPSRGTDIRGQGVWSAVICETPMEHWSVGLESFGAVFEDPTEAAGEERGDVVPFGLELEWTSSASSVAAPDGYGQWCDVFGEVLIGESRPGVSVVNALCRSADGWGWRSLWTSPGTL